MALPMRTLLILAIVTACGTDVRPGDDDGSEDSGDTKPDDGYEELIAADWTLPASTETYLCVRKTITQDTWIKAIRPVAPEGTHHTVLMIGAADGPDGSVECNSSLTKPALYASGVGTDSLEMPDGVAIHVKPGDQLLMNLHLFNAGDTALSGTAGIEIMPTVAVDAAHQAAVVLAGKASGLSVQPGMATQTGTCTTPGGHTIFAVAPHMHTRGIHMKVSYGARVLHDDDYSFDEQRFHVLAPVVQTVLGQKLQIECTYFNETAATIGFGESTTQEMCFALTFVYPVPPSNLCIR